MTLQPLLAGTAADVQNASALAQTCKLDGTVVGKLNGYPALYVQRSIIHSISPLSPVWECFTVGLLRGNFSDQVGFIGTEAAGPK